MAVQRQIWVLGFVVLAFNAAALAQMAASVIAPKPPDLRQSPSVDLATIVAQMETAQTANPARSQPYVLVRQYRFYQGAQAAEDAKSEVMAQVSFTPPNVKTFDILETRGSGRGTSVVKHILENESELSKDVSRNEISRKNYEFTLLGESVVDGRRAYILGLSPRRDDHSLLRGRVYVDAESFRILRTEGQPAKSPSWWLRSSYIILRYAEVEGLWLPVATEGTGEVRMFGRFMLNSQKVSVQVGNQVAAARMQSSSLSRATAARSPSASRSTQPRRSHTPVAVGAAVIPNP